MESCNTAPASDGRRDINDPFLPSFNSDDMSYALRASLRQVGLQNLVKVVDIPPVNLKRQLVHNRAYDRLCETPNCVVCPDGSQGDCNCVGLSTLAKQEEFYELG
ncbi:hypothetical protein RB195_020171 [Necator americanus]|uniref:Uncharacterized protein n=1 Tax=Necator americanus TaxID=51031 RepID=A0ABR1CI46_NECAM